MLRVYLCEDNEQQLARFKKAAEKTIVIEDYDMEIELSTTNPYELLEHKKNEQGVGLYFLDLDLGVEMDGFQLASEIRKIDPRSFIVFITTNSEASVITFQYKLEALDYIIKDNYDEIESRIHACITKAYQRYTSAIDEMKKVRMIKVGDRIKNVELSSIIAVETSVKEHKLIMHTDKKRFEYYGKLNEELEELGERFIRGHRSNILNVEKIDEIDTRKRIVYMTNGQEFVVSASGLRDLREKGKIR